MTTRYKAGSRVQQVWAAFEKGGAEAAEASAKSLSLAASTIKAWISGWQREKGGAAPKAAKVAKEKKAKLPPQPKQTAEERKAARVAARNTVNDLMSRRKVYASYWPGRYGYVVQDGPQVSQIDWEDGLPMEEYVSNENIKDAPSPPAAIKAFEEKKAKRLVKEASATKVKA